MVTLKGLPPNTHVGFITFGATVNVYDLAQQGVASCEVLPGNASVGADLLKSLVYGTQLNVTTTLKRSVRCITVALVQLNIIDRC